MATNLVIVESPAKAKTIEKFLGKDFKVMSSFGHISDLPSKELGVDIQNDFKPNYIVSADKKEVVKALKKAADEAEVVWLASDEDREGEAISWHLAQELKLPETKTKRIVFNSITKQAIEKAILNPRGIDYNLVNAQQARRVLDRLVGYGISPVLWKKVKTGLSAGRVQSVSVRLIVEKEREIQEFKSESAFKISAEFFNSENKSIKAKTNCTFQTQKEAQEFLQKNIGAYFSVSDLETKPAKKSPAPPFTTSTLQQEASRKLGFSVSKTMQVAQRLYESGYITYMRTDSVNLSQEAINFAKQEIINSYGQEYSFVRKFPSKEGAQEAHEAIRPTDMRAHSISADKDQARLYDLIWKRTIASQMADASLERSLVKISASTHQEPFLASGEVIKFEGFLKVYLEGQDDEDQEQEDILPALFVGENLLNNYIYATQKFSKAPFRYTEASLVKKLEELGIGRPSTYAPTISTIQNRGYVERSNFEGENRDYIQLCLQNSKISTKTLKEKVGADKGKLIPTNIGSVVNDFLVVHFNSILDYHFTANVEKSFDDIAEGKLNWTQMMKDFYNEFNPQVIDVEQNAGRETGERILGNDPKTGKVVSVRLGRYGAMAQIGSADDEEKPQFASLLQGMSIESISLEEALKLFELPKKLGIFQGKEVEANIGRFGPYIRFGDSFISIGRDKDIFSISMKDAESFILEKQKQDAPIATYQGLEVTKGKGRFGPFIKWNDIFINVPVKYNFDALTPVDIELLIKDKLKKESEKVVKEWKQENIRIEKARWGRFNLIGEKSKVELSKETNIETFSLEEAKRLLEEALPKKAVRKSEKTSTKTKKK